MKTVIKKQDLAESVKNKLDITRTEAMSAVNIIFEEMIKAFIEDNTVDISNFGKFEVKEYSARTGINPATKEKIEIPVSKNVKFKLNKKIKSQINEV